jgi:hypothetical protein
MAVSTFVIAEVPFPAPVFSAAEVLVLKAAAGSIEWQSA